MSPRITTAAISALVLTLTLVSCSGAPENTTPPTPEATAATPETSGQPPETTGTDGTETVGTTPSCETIISPGTVEALTAAGWTSEEKEFLIGGVPLPDGLLCFWGDYTVGSDHGQLYGWAEIGPSEATRAQSSLLAEGWRRIDGPEGIYITENPEYAMETDEEGYGMTYLFGDGWVKVADTKQGLVLVEGTG